MVFILYGFVFGCVYIYFLYKKKMGDTGHLFLSGTILNSFLISVHLTYARVGTGEN